VPARPPSLPPRRRGCWPAGRPRACRPQRPGGRCDGGIGGDHQVDRPSERGRAQLGHGKRRAGELVAVQARRYLGVGRRGGVAGALGRGLRQGLGDEPGPGYDQQHNQTTVTHRHGNPVPLRFLASPGLVVAAIVALRGDNVDKLTGMPQLGSGGQRCKRPQCGVLRGDNNHGEVGDGK
jgi:hypothetical protein